MQVVGLMVTKNECSKFLQACLEHHVPMFDEFLVFDDHSTDSTKRVSEGAGATYYRRPESVPTFMEHEGRFRQASVDTLARLFDLREGDWVLTVDSDEFVMVDPLVDLEGICRTAERAKAKSVRFRRPELWQLSPPRYRVDGFWDGICTRLYRHEPFGVIKDVPMASGAEPTRIDRAKFVDDPRLTMLHLGYVEPEWRQEKYDRYTSLANHGHNDRHIQSIVAEPKLKDWTGPMPRVWRGVHI